MAGLTKNTGKLSRFLLRRDRIRIPVWILSLAIITYTIALSFTDLYGSKADRQAIAETMLNPAMTAMVGQGYGLDNYTYGAMMAHQMLLFTAITVAIMSILLVTRHTRSDEEDGRIELIRSLPTGRLSNLFASLNVVFMTNFFMALLIGFGLAALDIESMDLEGSLLYGAALGAIGFFFTAITAVFAQLSENSRGVIGLSFFVLGIAYILRAIGDVSNETLSWISPLGWILGAEVYVNNYWWPILLTIGVSFILCILALYLNGIRDLGSGFLPAKPGKKYASVLLKSPLGLSFRLQRTGIIAWAIGMFVLGASYGSVLGDLDTFFEDIDMMKQMLAPVDGYSLTEQFITMLMSIMAMISTIPALMAQLKLMGEERKNRTEHLLSRAVSRTRLLSSSLIISILVSFVMLSLAALGLWSAGSVSINDGMDITVVYQAAIVYLPAMWVMIGLTAFLIGFLPQVSSWVWGYLIYSFIVVYLGNLIQFPEWMSSLSPFGHIPQIPIEDMNITAVTILTISAIGLMVLGFIGYRQRDIGG
ncbi:ABC transporter permease [Virgibacillus salexigens]|uniref:ABC transporter permease n=1 Tax=Virgibacillus kapii TaxID=1638645 RepID=A0ABQ2DT29_9BACI|nr:MULTISPECIES: ABC transporter permease [Virgibacillus]MYL43415.1 ABC transporter permease [Virgibacillus massiliensis]GGJ71199.1 ABC transporter permease [Virgibacillus kapii]